MIEDVVEKFVDVLVRAFRDQANAIAESVDRTNTTSDFGVAFVLLQIADVIERAWQEFAH